MMTPGTVFTIAVDFPTKFSIVFLFPDDKYRAYKTISIHSFHRFMDYLLYNNIPYMVEKSKKKKLAKRDLFQGVL